MNEPFGIGLYMDPVTGQFFVAEGVALLAGGVLWIAAVIAGLVTAWLVLP